MVKYSLTKLCDMYQVLVMDTSAIQINNFPSPRNVGILTESLDANTILITPRIKKELLEGIKYLTHKPNSRMYRDALKEFLSEYETKNYGYPSSIYTIIIEPDIERRLEHFRNHSVSKADVEIICTAEESAKLVSTAIISNDISLLVLASNLASQQKNKPLGLFKRFAAGTFMQFKPRYSGR
jgi:hypothetical protein